MKKVKILLALVLAVSMILPSGIVAMAETTEVAAVFNETDEVVGISCFEELQEALNNASTTEGQVTKITLAQDIEITDPSHVIVNIAGTEDAWKNVEIDGNDFEIKQVYLRRNWPENASTNKGMFVVTYSNVTFKNITVDTNYGGDGKGESNANSYENNLYAKNAVVVLESGATLKNGGPFGSSKGTAVGLMGDATFEMKTGSKITGAMCYGDTSTSSTIYINGANNRFIMNGGEISGNTSGKSGLIYAKHDANTGTEVILNSGSIINNTYKGAVYEAGTTNYTNYKGNQAKAIRFDGNGGISLEIGGDMVIEESIFLDKSHKKISVTSKLNNPIQIDEYWAPATLAVGKDYTLTAEDAAKFVFENGTRKVYLDPTANAIMCIAVDAAIPEGGIVPNGTPEGYIGVSNLDELKEAIAGASTDSSVITKIFLNDSISLSGDLAITGTEASRKYIEIDGNNKTIKLTTGVAIYPEYRSAGGGVVKVSYADVVFKNLTIDANFGGDGNSTSNSKYANCLGLKNGKVVLESGAVLKNGGPFGSSKGTAAGLMGDSYLEMKESSKITGAMCYGDTSTSSTIYIYGADNKFIMNGGEISGNTSGKSGLIYANHDSSTGTEVILNSGSIINNTYKGAEYAEGEANYVTYKGNQPKAIRFNGNGGINLEISGDMVIEESIFLDKEHKKINVTSKLSNPIQIDEYWVPATLAVGKDYTLTAQDASKFVFEKGTKKVYLDPTANAIMCIAEDADIPEGGVAEDSTTEDYYIMNESIANGVATFTLRSYKANTISGKAIVTLFNDGRPVAAEIHAEDISLGTNGTAYVKVTLPKDTTELAGLKARVFIWENLTNIVPQVKCLEKQY